MTPEFASKEPRVRKHLNEHMMFWGEDLAVVIGPGNELRQFSTKHILSRPQVTQIVLPWLRLLEDD